MALLCVLCELERLQGAGEKCFCNLAYISASIRVKAKIVTLI